MRVAYIAAGAGGMYCGSCLHDNTLAAALTRLGHDVALVPTYTPLRTDEANVAIDRVFYGAVQVYLEQKLPGLRGWPRPLDRALSSQRLLRWVSRLGSSVDARGLGPLTVSVLRGEEGRQRSELEKLVSWLTGEMRPEIVHLTNSMLLGLARRMREALRVPVLCSVQGEDLFLEQLREPYRSRARAVVRERAGDADAFIAPSRDYAGFMSDYLGVPAERMHCVALGVSLEGHLPRAPVRPDGPFVVGYLARICPEKGLHVLLEAFRLLAHEAGRDRVRLRVGGWLGPRDRPYFRDGMARVRAWGLEGGVEVVGEVDRRGKLDFLRSLDVLSVPAVYREPKGLYVLEALASGVPVVQPRHGAFPEMIEATGGGLLVEPGSPEALAAGLRALMEDPRRREELGRSGQEVVHRRYSDTVMAEETVKLYRAYLRTAGSSYGIEATSGWRRGEPPGRGNPS